ncbi:MAG: tetratricopeptide repeat protein [Acidobacteria bacterium]|nr:tetratricopeptide repeat protein [Acidobacteriota bacterium]
MFLRIAAACLSGVLWAQAGEAGPQAQFEQAAAALQRGDLALAEKLFAAFVERQPRHVGGLGNLGVVYSRQGLPARAAEVWERALRLAPADPAVRTNLGLAYLRLEEYAKARAVLEPVRTPQGRELFASAALYGGNAAEAIGVLEPLAPAPGVLYLLAVAQLKLGRKAEAAATFSKLESALSPDQVSFLRGKAAYETGSFDEALENLLAVKAATPGLALEMGKVYLSLRDAPKAEARLRDAVRETPLDSEANYFLGALLVQQDRAADGLPFLRDALRSRPDFWGAHFYLGRAMMAAGQPAKAVEALERARALRPQEAQIDFQLSKAYAAAGRLAEGKTALARFRKAREAHREAEREALVLR